VSARYIPEALFEAGFTDLISVVPPGAELLPSSKLSPSQLGKVPGRRTGNGLWVGYDWRRAIHTLDDVRRWNLDGANVGLRADRFPAVDIDCTDEALARVIEEAALAKLGPAPVRTGRAPKRLLMYRTDQPFGRMRLWIEKGDTHHLVEVLGQGQQYLVHGIHPATQRAYEWDGDPATLMPEFLEPITREKVDAFLTELGELLELMGAGLVTREGDGRAVTWEAGEQKGLVAPSIEALREAVRMIPNNNLLFPDRSSYLKMGYAIRAACGAEVDEGAGIFAEWADKWEGNGRLAGNDPEVVRQDWRRMRGPYAIGWTWIAETARPYGFNDTSLVFEVVETKKTEPDERAPAGSDQWLAERVAERQRGVLRYVPERGSWIVWHAGRWTPDAALLAEDLIKRELKTLGIEAMRAAGASAKETNAAEKFAREICSAGKVSAVASLVRTDRAVAVRLEALDHDPWVLNTPNGLVDLRSGGLLPPDPDALCTKQTSVPPDFSGACPRWLRFLDEACGGDGEVVAYLKRLMGYALTGSTREQHLTFIWGDGGNGKGVFLNTFTGILGDYAEAATMETFTAAIGDRNTADVASLAGSRLVTASETQAGKRWDEARVKALTGGDPIKARFLYQNHFTFRPAFKLVFIGNHKPEIRDVGPAMKRRIQLVEFNQRPTVVDQELGDKLREEWPAILAWMIQGCLEWQAEGLQPPERVLVSTAAYFAEEDVLGRWMAEETSLDSEAVEGVQSLFQSWEQWTKAGNEYTGTLKRFSTALAAKGFAREQDQKTRRRQFRGLRLKPTAGFEVMT
jgi:putative DNA primase/helicase